MLRATAIQAGLAAFGLMVAFGSSAGEHFREEVERADYSEMSAEKLAEHLMFEAGGFAIDDKTQEGGTVGDRLKQDRIQKICSEVRGGRVSSDTAETVRKVARSNLVYPDDGVELGDWKKGQSLAENAFGFRVGHKVDDHSEGETGGMCINCHAMEEEKSHRSGTMGPSLVDYGDQRGRSRETIRYTYEMIYNPHVAFPCTNMPRLGANGVLSQEKISHILAYLLDPASPVNQ